ncbi:HAD family hydrolase [Haloarchaeobius amylolyticus]|uniref:HAD family hydrolase n=1 Tax=Haloarchaeobius amylolyticus TaxID=1198296 RepID=UPI0022708E64|nr:HAD family hydrolase [Haloarchaeobius amylolyticus]
MYDAVVFDMDGVLLRRHPDYPDVYREAVHRAFESFDVNPPESDLQAFYGESSKSLEEMRSVCERHGLAFESFWQEREHQSATLQARMLERNERVLYDDAAVVETLATSHDLGVVSNNQHATVESVVAHFDLDEYFQTIHGRDPTVEGYRRTKPDPHYLERALDDLGTRSALYIGDGASDVVAAHRAGLDSVFVRRPHRRGDDLQREPTAAVEELRSLPELLR